MSIRTYPCPNGETCWAEECAQAQQCMHQDETRGQPDHIQGADGIRYAVKCKACGDVIWIGGSYEPDTNALELDENDRYWDEACEHIKAGGDYELSDAESYDFEDR